MADWPLGLKDPRISQADPDDALWFTLANVSGIGRITTSTAAGL